MEMWSCCWARPMKPLYSVHQTVHGKFSTPFNLDLAVASAKTLPAALDSSPDQSKPLSDTFPGSYESNSSTPISLR